MALLYIAVHVVVLVVVAVAVARISLGCCSFRLAFLGTAFCGQWPARGSEKTARQKEIYTFRP